MRSDEKSAGILYCTIKRGTTNERSALLGRLGTSFVGTTNTEGAGQLLEVPVDDLKMLIESSLPISVQVKPGAERGGAEKAASRPRSI
jgi:hypothetical protein